MPAKGVFISWLTEETNSAFRFCSVFWSPMSRSTATAPPARRLGPGLGASAPASWAAVARYQCDCPAASAISTSSVRWPAALRCARAKQQLHELLAMDQSLHSARLSGLSRIEC